jgi:PAS domain S-box-containing protein
MAQAVEPGLGVGLGFLDGGGGTGTLIRAYDWAATPLGPPETWPQSLRSALSICLHSSFPTAIYWGPELRLLYNEAWAPIPAERHPWALGRPGAEVWADIWDVVGPQFARVVETGEGFSTYDQMLPMVRAGVRCETYWNYSFTPIRGEDGSVVGVFNQGHETTNRVLDELRGRFLLDLGDRLRALSNARAIIETAQEALGRFLTANRVGYGEVEETARYFTTEHNWTDGSVPSREGTHDLAGFGPDVLAALRAGIPLLIPDVASDPRTNAPESLAAFDAIDTRAGITASLVKEGRMRAALYVHAREPRPWTEHDAELVAEVAERTWAAVERVRAEADLRDSEARFRSMMADAVPQIVWITDADGRNEFFNRQWFDYTGAQREPTTAAEVAATFLHPEDVALTMAAFDQARQTGSTYTIEHRIRSADGEYRWFLVRGEPYRDPRKGTIVRWYGASIDIHDRRQAETQLRESEERLRFLDRLAENTQTLTDATEIMSLTARLVGQHLRVSICAYADMDEDEDGFTIRGDWSAPGSSSIVGRYRLADFGRLAVESLSAGLPLVVNDNLVELAPEEAATFRNIGIAATICMPLVKGGRLTALMAIHDRAPRVWTEAELSLLREVTARSWAHVERVAAVAELRVSEARYRTLFEAVDAGFCVVEMKFDLEGRAIDYRLAEINPAFERQTGLYDAAGKWVSEAAPGLERHWYDIYGRVALTGETVRFENHAEPFGRWYDVHAFRTGAPDEHRVAILFNDITERKHAGDRLRELNATLEERVAARTAERNHLWTLTEDMLARADYQGRMSAVNPAWTKVLGWSEQELLTNPYADIIHPEDVEVTVAALLSMGETKQPTRFENRILTSSGKWKPIGWTVSPEPDGMNFIAVGRDLTDYKAREQQLLETQEALRQAQKMEAMGQLTGGVAHDFNNLLTPIVGSLDMLQRRGLGGEREQRLIAGAMQSADRAKTLVQRLLAFARRQPLQPTAVDVSKLVDGMADLLASTSGPQIRLVVETDKNLPAAQADPNQLEMALLNLGVNARDAMPDGGTLRITATAEAVGLGHRSRLTPGIYVLLSVADTGIGMDEATLARAVEPFFSTKGIGRGTGLGLSMVHGLASQLGGALTIQSRLGVGTNIELWLPASAAQAEVSGSIDNVAPATAVRGVALLVDDEEPVRMSTADMLIDLGYEVTEATSAEEALRLLNSGLYPDLLVTDHLMPGMNGTDLARFVKSERPRVKVLIISGYAESEGIAPDLPRLTKPFRNVELAASLAALTMAGAE